MRTQLALLNCWLRLSALTSGILLFCLAGCKPKPTSDEALPQKADASDQEALNLSGVDALDRVLVADESQIRVAIAKRILGLNPDRYDRHDHIGLMNLADLMGLSLAFNDCEQPWLVTDRADVISLTSQHHRGMGRNCQMPKSDSAVTYTFSDWVLAPEAVETKRWSEIAEPQFWPKPGGSSNAQTASKVIASIDTDGALNLSTKETSVASVTAHDELFSHKVKYERTLRAQPEFQKFWRPADFGLQIVPSVGGGATFVLGSSTQGPGRLERLSCAADVLQPPGCHYRVTLAAEHQIKQQKYLVMVNLVPQVVTLSGRLLANKDCKHKPSRRTDSTCDESEPNSDGRLVSESFGKAGELHFGEALTQLVSENKGNWLWSNMRNEPLAQKSGIPTLDWALRYFADEAFGNLSFEFAATTETIRSCTLKVETLPGSASNCQSLQDGATIEPIKIPIL